MSNKQHQHLSDSSGASQAPQLQQRGISSQNRYGNSFLAEQLNETACEDHEVPEDQLGSVRASAPSTKAEALTRHEENRGIMEHFIQSALSVQVDPSQGFNSRANLLRNSAE